MSFSVLILSRGRRRLLELVGLEATLPDLESGVFARLRRQAPFDLSQPVFMLNPDVTISSLPSCGRPHTRRSRRSQWRTQCPKRPSLHSHGLSGRTRPTEKGGVTFSTPRVRGMGVMSPVASASDRVSLTRYLRSKGYAEPFESEIHRGDAACRVRFRMSC